MFTKQLLALVVGITLLFGSTGQSRADLPLAPSEWRQVKTTTIGPGTGGFMIGTWVRPNQPNYVVTSGDMGQTFWSENYGTTWQSCTPRMGCSPAVPSVVTCVLFDSRSSNCVWMGGFDGVFRTSDHYGTWQLLTPSWEGKYPYAMVQDPVDPNIIWVACSGSSRRYWDTANPSPQGLLAVTRDNGATWSRISGGGFPTSGTVWGITLDPSNHLRVLAATSSGMYKSEDGGAAWVNADTGIDKDPARGFIEMTDVDALTTATGTRFLACARYAVPANTDPPASVLYYSTDGAQWTAGSTVGLANDESPAVPYLTRRTWGPLDTYGTNISVSNSNVLWLVSWWEVFRSTDGGATWTKKTHWTKPGVLTSFLDGDTNWIYDNPSTTGLQRGWMPAGNGKEVVTATSDPYTAYLTSDVWRTRDGGELWTNIEDVHVSQNQGRDFWGSRGMSNLVAQRVTTDSRDWQKVFMGFNDCGFMWSTDAGGSVFCNKQTPNVLPSGMGMFWEVYATRFDPAVERLWCSQVCEMGLYQSNLQTGDCRVYSSENGGLTFTSRWDNKSGADQGVVVDVLVNPDSPITQREVFLSAAGKGVYRSNNNGQTWNLLDNDALGTIPGISRMAWSRRPDPEEPDALFVVANTPANVNAHHLYLTWEAMRLVTNKYGTINSPSGLYRRLLDDGETWTRVLAGEIHDVKVHPVQSNIVYCTGKDGLYKSTDRGATWTLLFEPLTNTSRPYGPSYFGPLDIDPTDPDIVYFWHERVGQLQESERQKPFGLYKTMDGGESFTYLGQDIPAIRAMDLHLSPNKPDTLYIATTSTGVLRIDDSLPYFTSQPIGQTVWQWDPVVLDVTAEGPGTLSYQWYKDGQLISGAQGSEYVIQGATEDTPGSYTVRVSNATGYVTSAPAELKVYAWQQANVTGPSARARYAMCYDPSRHTVLLFGGEDASGPRSDTWEFNGTTWRQVTAVNGITPTACRSHVMGYNEYSQEGLLFGGQGRTGTNPPYTWTNVGDTWTWTWSGEDIVWTSQSPTNPPTARSQASLVYEAGWTQMLLVGGNTNAGPSSERWSHLGDWGFTDSDALPARYGQAMTYIGGEGIETLLFGGTDGTDVFDDTWLVSVDGGWAEQTGSGPSGRYGHALAYDPSDAFALMFGGNTGIAPLNETWTWTSSAGWQQVTSSTPSPSARKDHALVFDPSRGVFVLFGGETANGFSGETWELRLLQP
jgi:hypothetical protein